MRNIRTGVKLSEVMSSPIVYSLASDGMAEPEFLKALRSVSKTIKGSWAYSTDHIQTKIDSSFNVNTVIRRYFAFESEIDAMQFTLTFDTSQRAYIWPKSVRFTAHMYHSSETSE